MKLTQPLTRAQEFQVVKTFLEFSRQLFVVLEWLTITAAVTYAAIKTHSIVLWLIGYALQLIIAIYILFAAALWLRPRFGRLKNSKWRLILGAATVALVAFGGDWLVKDTVFRLVRTQLPGVPSSLCMPCSE